MDVKVDKVYTFKMMSGEEIVGRVVHKNADHFVVEAPLSMAPTQQGLQMMPSLFSTDLNPEANIYFRAIGMVSKPREDVADSYRESISGIKVPDKQILLS